MITDSIIHRVFYIKHNTSTGTQYLVTAKHIFSDKASGDNADFQLYYEERWIDSSEEKIYFHEIETIDIAVIPLKKHLYKGTDVKASYNQIALGQDIYFLGFPYNLKAKKLGTSHPFPMPLIKKGILSAIVEDENKATKLYLDGHNNPGFSGGPAVFKNFRTNEEFIFGVISAYFPQYGKIKTPLGEFDYHENSGIIIAYSADYANDIINKIKTSYNNGL